MNTGVLYLLMVAFLGYMFWTQWRQKKKRDEMLRSLTVGERILTGGGVYGVIRAIDGSDLEVEIADGVLVRVALAYVSERANLVEPEEPEES